MRIRKAVLLFEKKKGFCLSDSSLQLTHAECVRVWQAGSDLHFTVRALGAGLAGFVGPHLFWKCSRATHLAHRVSLRATLPDNTLSMGTIGAWRTHAINAPKEEAIVTLTLCVLSCRARSQHGDTERALSTGTARAEVFRWGKRSWETRLQNQHQSLDILCFSQISVAMMRRSAVLNLPASWTDDRDNDKSGKKHIHFSGVTVECNCSPCGHGEHLVSSFPHSTSTPKPAGHWLQHSPDSVKCPLAQASPRATYRK